MEITQELVREIYDYSDGYLYYKIHRKSSMIGSRAGSVHTQFGRTKVLLKGKFYRTYHIIFLWHHGRLPKGIDHIDRNQLNDRIENLREADKAQNNRNKTSHKNSTSKYLGVSWSKAKRKWLAQIHTKNKQYNLGLYINEKDAALAYNEAAKKCHGEFANLNIIE